MPNGRSHIRGFLRYLHEQNGRGCSKTFETYILQAWTTPILHVDDTYVKRKRDKADTLFDALNSYHPNIKFKLDQKVFAYPDD